MSCLVRPTDASASRVASIIRSSRLLFQCSRNGVHDIPTMATLSFIPFELIGPPPSAAAPMSPLTPYSLGLRSSLRCGARSSDWPCLPEVVVNAVGGEQAAKGHLDAPADLHIRLVDVGQLAREPPATLEVEDGEDHRRTL